jgi:hypothetical protein
MKRGGSFWGILLIILGILSLSNRIFGFNLFSMNYLWPLFVLIPGLIFEFSFFTTRRSPGILVPGGILSTIGFLFLFETLTNLNFSEYTWPIYPLSVAIGLFQLYLFDRRQPGLLIPVFILAGISIISFLSMVFGNILTWLNYSLLIPVALILIGVYILFKNSSRQ